MRVLDTLAAGHFPHLGAVIRLLDALDNATLAQGILAGQLAAFGRAG